MTDFVAAKEIKMTISRIASGGAVALVVLTLLAGCITTGGSAGNADWSGYYNNFPRAGP